VDWAVTNEVTVGDALVAEWRFDYRQNGEDRSFFGATVATARDGEIAELREYAVTAPLYT
jgi:ketosteroid isomerase-like protein